MVSFHTPLKTIRELENSTKKRKWEEVAVEELLEKPLILNKEPKSTKPIMFDTELLHLDTPLPSEWQRCLDIQSGQIHYYNMRTQTRTSKDPRTTNQVPDPPPTHMSLDLELNLPCGSLPTGCDGDNDLFSNKGNECPSWLAFEADEREMITAVCNKCHMLVMMCKSSPACPNCKFVHPPDQTPPNNVFINKPAGLSLLC